MPVKKLSDLTTLTGITGTDSIYIARSGTNYNTTISNVISGMNINTGTGTANYIVKFTATGTTVGNSVIFDDGTNVGIGTTGPVAKLDVMGTVLGVNSNAYLGGIATSRFVEIGTTAGGYAMIQGRGGHGGTITGQDISFQLDGGNVGIGLTGPTAVLHLKAGTATASTAPLKFTSGTLLGTAEAGAIEFLTDAFYGTITTGAARKTFAFLESPIFTGTVTIPTPFTLGATSVTSTGTQLNYLSSTTGTTGTTSTNIVFSTSPTITYLSLAAGSTGAGTGALKFTSGSLLSSIESGVVEFDGNTYYVSTSIRHALNGTIFVSTGNAGPSGSTTETTLIGSGPSWCSVILPANYLVAGKTFLLRAAGTYTTPAGSTQFTIKFKLTSTNSNYILSTGAFTPSASITNESWNLDLIFTCRAVGAYSTPATISPRAILEYRDSTASATALQHAPMVTASGSAYTDQAITIALTSTIGGTYSSANWTCTNFSIVMLD